LHPSNAPANLQYVVTPVNFVIALIAALIGYVMVESLRDRI
jgi:hypothetical protein